MEFAAFGNTNPPSTNLLYRLYHRVCQAKWRLSGARKFTSEQLAAARDFGQSGFFLFPPTAPAMEMERLQRRIDDALDGMAAMVGEDSRGTVALRNGLEEFPELESFLTDEVTSVVEAHFGSHYKVFSAVVYRIFPVEAGPESSFLWHFDNTPNLMIKLMVYLDRSTKETGAFRLKPRALSLDLKRRGYWDRNNAARFRTELEDESTTRVFEGDVGTSVLFQPNTCVHKATHPTTGHRDVIVFFMHPSLVPWRQHLEENRRRVAEGHDSCRNPFTDQPRYA